MTLKQKSLLISLSTTVIFLLVIVIIVYQVITTRFQQIENQRVERNIRRISAVLEDRFSQISSKLTDWTNWDDSYKFMQDKNKAYVSSNLIPESFHNIGVDEALFIGKNGELVASIDSVVNENEKNNFPEDLYSKFSTGSALLKMNEKTNYSRGILRTNDGILLFAAREVLKSDQSGPSAGVIVFARYLDKNVLNSVKELTQFEANMYLIDDSNLPIDFLPIKDEYQKNGVKELVRILDNNTISGYLVIEDIYNKPQAIVRSDIGRDISLQGKSSMLLLMWLLVGAGILMAGMNYWLVTGGVLRKISLMATDVDNLGKSGAPVNRLRIISKTADEVDKLGLKINTMLDSLQKSESQLSNKQQFINTVLDSLTIGIAVNQSSNGNTIYMNPAFEKIYGWKKEELSSVDDFFNKVFPDPKIHDETKARILADIKSGDIERMHWHDLEITKSNGEKRFIDARNIPIVDQDLMVSTVTDVTDEKGVEEKRENYAKELERLNELMVNREIKMIALKKELAEAKQS